MSKNIKQSGPKILIFDIETAPIIGHVWSLWENNVALNQVVSDWHVLSWSAKWLDSKKVMYKDQRGVKPVQDDSKLLLGIWKLLDEADIVISKNGIKFDSKKLNARFILNGFQPPSSYKHIDLEQVARKKFCFTSNKLEYLTDKLCTKYKKQKHKKYPGHELWVECLKGNVDAWNSMQKYNTFDVLSTEELYTKLIPWDTSREDFNKYTESNDYVCKCGNSDFHKRGFYYSATGKFQKHRCKHCGAEYRDSVNLLTKEKRKSLLRGV
jgi:hypothetical protein